MSISEKICRRCSLRAKPSRDIQQYDEPSHETPGFSCCVCLGVLHESSISKITSIFSNQISSITHNNLVKVNATIPPSISVIRERAFQLFLLRQPSSKVSAVAKSAFSLVSMREALKWTLSARLSRLFDINYSPDSEVFLDVSFKHVNSVNEASFIAIKNPPAKSRKRYETNTTADSTTHVTRVVEALSDSDFEACLPQDWVPPPPSPHVVDVSLNLSTAPIYIAGTYNKWSRIVSQTPWFIDDGEDPALKKNEMYSKGKNDMEINETEDNENNDVGKTVKVNGRQKRTEISVEEIVLEGMQNLFKPDKATFSAGGREDVDVRMLGDGRPFLVELTNPHIISACVTSEHIKAIETYNTENENKTNGTNKLSEVTINNLQFVQPEFSKLMKAFEENKRKHYRCVVWCEKPMIKEQVVRRICDNGCTNGSYHGSNDNKTDDGEGGLLLQQQTPLRVLHRRTQAIRQKRIFNVKISQWISSHFFVLDVEAQAGTYIKEFIHGDHGRTVPSVASLLECDVDILQLDVVQIESGISGFSEA